MITSLANYLPGNSRKAPNILHGQIPWGAMPQWKVGAQQTWPGCIFIYAICNKIHLLLKIIFTYKLVWTAASACPARPVSAWAHWGRSWGQSQGSSSCQRGQQRRGWGRPPALSLTLPREDMGAWLSGDTWAGRWILSIWQEAMPFCAWQRATDGGSGRVIRHNMDRRASVSLIGSPYYTTADRGRVVGRPW